jgi:hypothetical protein
MNPSPHEVQQYRMLSDAALMRHRLLMASGVLPKPDHMPLGASDAALSTELKTILKRTSPAMKRQLKKELLIALDDTEVPGGMRTNPAVDDDGQYDHTKVSALMQFLQDKLDEGELGQAMTLLDAAFPKCLGDLDGAEDQPPPFEGRPEVGHGPRDRRALAADARLRHAANAEDDYSRMFPDTTRIGLDPWPSRET